MVAKGSGVMCSSCKEWVILDGDHACGFCGAIQVGIQVFPRNLKLPAGATGLVHLKNETAEAVSIDVVQPRGQNVPLRTNLKTIRLEPGHKNALVVEVVAEKVVDSVPESSFTIGLRLQGRKIIIPVDILVLSASQPRLVEETVVLGTAGPDQTVAGAVLLVNEGGTADRLSSIAFTSAAMTHTVSLPMRLPYGEQKTIPVSLDLADDERVDSVEMVLDFEISGKQLKAQLSVERHSLKLDPPGPLEHRPLLCRHYAVHRLVVENDGNQPFSAVELTTKFDWLLLRREGAPPKSFPMAAGEKAAMELIVDRTQLPVGEFEGTVEVKTDGLSKTLTIRGDVPQRQSYPGYVGIDFGTSASVVSILHSDKSDEWFFALDRLADGEAKDSRLISSTITFGESLESYSVGAGAAQEGMLRPERSIQSIKRALGSEREFLIHGKSVSPTEIAARVIEKLLELAEARLWEELGSAFEIDQAIVTAPVDFYGQQIEDLLSACKAAGLHVDLIGEENQPNETAALGEIDALSGKQPSRDENNGERGIAESSDREGTSALDREKIQGVVTSEPLAAAFRIINELRRSEAVGERHDALIERSEGMRVLVYDHGAGTLDVVIVRITAPGDRTEIKVLESAGHNGVGGDEFDCALLEVALEKAGVGEEARKIFTEDEAAFEWRASKQKWSPEDQSELRGSRLNLRRSAEAAKVALGTKEEVSFLVPMTAMVEVGKKGALLRDNRGRLAYGEGGAFTVGREEYEAVCEPLLKQSTDTVLRVLEYADLQPKEIDLIFHAGRQSYLESIRERIGAIFEGQEVQLQENLIKFCVAAGAALYGQGIHEWDDDAIIFVSQDQKLPFSFGIGSRKWGREQYKQVIPRGATYPATFSVLVPIRGRRGKIKVYRKTGQGGALGNNGMPLHGYAAFAVPSSERSEGGKVAVEFSLDANRRLRLLVGGKEVDLVESRSEHYGGGYR